MLIKVFKNFLITILSIFVLFIFGCGLNNNPEYYIDKSKKTQKHYINIAYKNVEWTVFVGEWYNKAQQWDYTWSLMSFDKAINMWAISPAVYGNRWLVKYRMWNYIWALMDFDKAIELDPFFWNAYYLRSHAAFLVWRTGQAYNDYNKSIKYWFSDFTDIELDKLIKISYHIVNNDYDSLNREFKKNPIYNLYVEWTEKWSKWDYNGALINFNKCIELDNNSYMVYYSRWLLKIGMKNYSWALLDFNKAIEFFASQPQIYRERSMIKYFLGDYEWALLDIDKAWSFWDSGANFFMWRGNIYVALNKYDLACDNYIKASNGWIKEVDQIINEFCKKQELEYSFLKKFEKNSSKNCIIKWNISYNTREKIYHVPWCENYYDTKINTSYWERWFCTEQEAINAWWRKAWNCP